MPLLIPDNFPILLVYDTTYQHLPVSILLNTQLQIVTIFCDGENITKGPIAAFAEQEIENYLLPNVIHTTDELALRQKDSLSPVPPPEAFDMVEPEPTASKINPAEALRQEVAAEKAKMPQSAPNAPPPPPSSPSQQQPSQPQPQPSVEAIASPPSDAVLHTYSVCDRCPVACKVDITHSPTGKLIGVTGNACERGVGYAQNLLLERYSEPLGF